MFTNRPAMNSRSGDKDRKQEATTTPDSTGVSKADIYHIRDRIQRKLLNESIHIFHSPVFTTFRPLDRDLATASLTLFRDDCERILYLLEFSFMFLDSASSSWLLSIDMLPGRTACARY